MNHVGDITKLDGAKLEPVWCITGGSPCQDLSVAGKGAGLGGERSGLFHEQIRIIKEMIQHDRDLQRPDELIRPRFSIWENVPGAFSSNGGEDFRTVLEEFARIAEPDAVIPRPPKGKWPHAGAILGDGWSLAWRLFDAQYWGVPQRRKRIALVADFGGLSAPEILFERKGVSRDSEQSGAQGEETSRAAGGGVASTITATYGTKWNGNAGAYSGGNFVIEPVGGGAEGASSGVVAKGNGDCFLTPERHTSLTAGGGQAGQGYPCVLDERGAIFYDAYQHHGWRRSETSGTLTVGQNNTVRGDTPLIAAYGIDQQGGKGGANYTEDVCPPILSDSHGTPHAVAYGISSYDSNAMKSQNPHSGIYEADTARTLDLNGGSPACNQGWIAVVQSVGCDVYNHKGCGERQGVEREVVCSWDGTQIAPTLTANNAGGSQRMPDKDNFNAVLQYAPDTAHALHGKANCQFREDSETYVAAVDCRNGTENPNINGTLQAKEQGGYNMNSNNVCRTGTTVRRLTPLECERLQGYPDGWTDIDGASDSARYKALGNSIALPQWQWIIDRMARYLPDGATLGSLFDGIGGFPLCWERTHGKGTARWASEIEKFPIRVTRIRFPDK